LDAIVLTCDKYRQLTEHMIFQYDRLWPDHKFRFLIPFQNDRGVDSAKRKFIRTDSSIKQTVLTLLSVFHDEDWVYWTIDDKYPIILDVHRIKKIERWLLKQPHVNGVLFCRSRKLRRMNLTSTKITDSDANKYYERRDWQRIWMHQFIRVKLLRLLFNALPEVVYAKELDTFKDMPTMPRPDLLFVRHDTLAVFGESTSRGVLTLNCFESMANYGVPLPTWFRQTTGTRVVRGEKQFWESHNRAFPLFARASAALSRALARWQ
jgi:hypothetical protein